MDFCLSASFLSNSFLALSAALQGRIDDAILLGMQKLEIGVCATVKSSDMNPNSISSDYNKIKIKFMLK